jgi:hypothetical protein
MIKLLLLTAFLAGIIFLADHFFSWAYIHPAIWIMLIFFLIVSIISHFITNIGVRKKDANVINYYFSTMLIRLLLSIGFIGFFVYSKAEDIFLFVANFFILYLLYVGFEIYWLLTNLRRNSKNAG